MPKYYISISPGLMTKEHHDRMQVNQKTSCIWVYLWLIDKITNIDKETQLGMVLGGRSLNYNQIAPELHHNIKTMRQIIRRLYSEGYIYLKRMPRGQIIAVIKAKKSFGHIMGTTAGKTVTNEKNDKQSGRAKDDNLVGQTPKNDNNLVALIRQYKNNINNKALKVINIKNQKTKLREKLSMKL
ncbi:MAG TPA: hypothetical protein VFX17_03695 [Patescibacteria group bacterium]|nr:hypothetical protein [Patescibacteria group bacterium]